MVTPTFQEEGIPLLLLPPQGEGWDGGGSGAPSRTVTTITIGHRIWHLNLAIHFHKESAWARYFWWYRMRRLKTSHN